MKEGKYRVSRVVTRSGDKGETGLSDGSRWPKHDKRFELLGALDELNSSVGYLLSLDPGSRYLAMLDEVQQLLFDLGAEIASPGLYQLEEHDLSELEEHTERMTTEVPPLKEFLLPGGSQAGAWAHLCRTQARRAERCLTAVAIDADINPISLAWLNRLSDFFFVLARHINQDKGVKEPEWRGPHRS